MKGFAILTEARSGSEWLCRLVGATGRMGRPAEWLDPGNLGLSPRDGSELLDAVLARAATQNGRFGLKLFPLHLRWAQERFGIDALRELMARFETGLLVLERRDRLRQAVSLARARMTGRWNSRMAGTGGAERYDFEAVLQAYFQIERGHAFWQAYLGVLGLRPPRLFYEDLAADPKPFLDLVAGILGVEPEPPPPAELAVQRDAATEEWAKRFRADAAARPFLASLITDPAPARTASNLLRFLRKRPFGPDRHGF